MIVIPMAGLSQRFARAGYPIPKFMLPLGDAPVFDHAIGGFSRYFATLPFLFILRDEGEAAGFVAARSAALGIADARTVLLDAPTAGQAETVAHGIDGADLDDATPLTIFNIDTFRPGFALPDKPWFAGSDGYLEVFRGTGDNWSYVRPLAGEPDRAAETAEKRPISDLCCTGLYHFARTADFRDALAAERAARSSHELFVAPLYNHLIARGRRIHYALIGADAVRFCGVPDEYLALGGLAPEDVRATPGAPALP